MRRAAFALQKYFLKTYQLLSDCPTIVYIYVRQKWGDNMSPRTGRPTDNPKPYKITVRIDEKGKQILDKFCEQKNVNQNEAIWRGILRLEEEIKK